MTRKMNALAGALTGAEKPQTRQTNQFFYGLNGHGKGGWRPLVSLFTGRIHWFDAISVLPWVDGCHFQVNDRTVWASEEGDCPFYVSLGGHDPTIVGPPAEVFYDHESFGGPKGPREFGEVVPGTFRTTCNGIIVGGANASAFYARAFGSTTVTVELPAEVERLERMAVADLRKYWERAPSDYPYARAFCDRF